MVKRMNSVSSIRKDLLTLKNILTTDEIRLAGGEPLLNPSLLEIIKNIKAIGIAKKITLITNGVLLHKMSKDIWQEIDQLWLSLYPNIKYQWNITEIRKKCNQYQVRLWEKHMPTFQLTMLNNKIPKKFRNFVFQNCGLAHEWSCNLIHRGRFYRCAPAAYMQERQALNNIEFDNKKQDSVDLYNKHQLKNTLKQYLDNKTKPLQACSYCLGSLGKEIPNVQLNNKRRQQELLEDHSNLAMLISPKSIIRSMITKPFRETQTLQYLKNFYRYGNIKQQNLHPHLK